MTILFVCPAREATFAFCQARLPRSNNDFIKFIKKYNTLSCPAANAMMSSPHTIGLAIEKHFAAQMILSFRINQIEPSSQDKEVFSTESRASKGFIG